MANSKKAPQKAGKKSRPSGMSLNKTNRKSQSIPLMTSQVPKNTMRISGDKDLWRVSGSEIIKTINPSQHLDKSSFQVNPLQNDLFPRLSGFALQFQRYRFTKLRLHYFSACPATRSGALGLAISTQYESASEIPDTFIELGSYEYGSVNTVASSFSTPVWKPNSAEKYNMPSSDLEEDPFKIYQATLMFLTGDADEKDNGLHGGYVTVEYDLDLFGWRPTVNRMMSIASRTPITFNATNSVVPLTGVAGVNDLSSIRERVGNWGVDKFKDFVETSDDPLGSVVTGIKAGFDYGLRTFLPLTAVLASMDAWDEIPEVKGKITRRSSQVSSYSSVVYYNAEYVEPDSPSWIPMDEKERSRQKYGEHLSTRMLPMAAGDVTLGINAIGPDGKVQNLYLSTSSPGTGATNGFASIGFTMPEDTSALAISVVLPSGEQRQLITTGINAELLKPYHSITANSARRVA